MVYPMQRIIYDKIPMNSLCKISIIILDEKISEIIKDFLIKADVIDILGKLITLNSIEVKNVRVEEIFKNAKPLKKFSINYLTPTSFRKSAIKCCEHCYVYSMLKKGESKSKEAVEEISKIKLRRGAVGVYPELLPFIKNLIRLVNRFFPVNFNIKEFEEWLDYESIVISGFPSGIKTIRVYEHKVSNKYVIGFIGKVNYSIREKLYNENYAQILNGLLKLAEYTNMGIGRTAGLGWIKVEEYEE
jgi:Uncharacterized conserved protein